MKRLLWTLLFALLLPTSVLAKDSYVMVDGMGVHKAEAIQDGLRNAIAQVVGIFLESETFVQNFVTEYDRVHTSTNGFVKAYRVLKEHHSAAEGYTLRMRVTVEPDEKKVIKQLRKLIYDRSFSVDAIALRIADKTIVANALDDDLNSALIEKGYYVVNDAFGQAFYHIHGHVSMRVASSQYAEEGMSAYALDQIRITVSGKDGLELFQINERDVDEDVLETGKTPEQAAKAALYLLSPAIVKTFLNKMSVHASGEGQ